MHLVTIVAMAVQLGVVAYHHHDVVVDHDAAHTVLGAVVGHDTHQSADHADHGQGDHAPGQDHRDPVDGDHQDCDLCLLKSSVASALLAHASGGLWVAASSTRLHLANREAFYRDAIGERYRARAPPSETLFS